MQNFIESVIDFNQRVLGIEQREIGPLEQGEHEATVKAFHEEINEYVAAHNQFDLVGQVDAVVDLIYFAVGSLYKKGLSANQIGSILEVVHNSNMTKKLGVVEKRGNPLGDAVKPEGWVGPEEAIAAVMGG
jgi:predicted HAD superfamily Cof-like phosphohydrolase